MNGIYECKNVPRVPFWILARYISWGQRIQWLSNQNEGFALTYISINNPCFFRDDPCIGLRLHYTVHCTRELYCKHFIIFKRLSIISTFPKLEVKRKSDKWSLYIFWSSPICGYRWPSRLCLPPIWGDIQWMLSTDQTKSWRDNTLNKEQINQIFEKKI